MEQLLGPVMLDLEGTQLTEEERVLLQHPLVGGVILFTRNFMNAEQLQDLIQEIRACRSPIIISVDQEGGRVQRFRSGFSAVPAMSHIGQVYEQNIEAAYRYAFVAGQLIAGEMLALGIDISFAPVLDLNHGISAVIGDRAFSADPETITQLARHFIAGMAQQGMAATGKHFPGHGAVAADSHVAIPEDTRSFNEIVELDLVPFKNLAGELQAIMPAHIIYSQVDSQPAGFSVFWLQKILRQQLGFKGVIFSDDLSMEGASGVGDFGVRAQQALAAGCTMVLVCNHRSGALAVLESLSKASLDRQAIHTLLMTLLAKPHPRWPEYAQSVERLALQAELAGYQ